MKKKLMIMVKNLLTFWVVNFILIGIGMSLVVFIGLPITTLMLKGTLELLPGWDVVYKSIYFVIFAAFSSGTILWIKEEFFPNK